MGSINLPKLLSLSFLAIFVKSRKTHLKYGKLLHATFPSYCKSGHRTYYATIIELWYAGPP